jgi:hypothetical protein
MKWSERRGGGRAGRFLAARKRERQSRVGRKSRHGARTLDLEQARTTALLWHGRLWSPYLYCYATLGCTVGTEAFRRGAIKETLAAIETLEKDPAAYGVDERKKLDNLLACIRAGRADP